MSFEVRDLVTWWRDAGIDVVVRDAAGASIDPPSRLLARAAYDHRQCDGQTMFCAVQGESTHGVRFLRDAFAAGVAVALVEGRAPILDDVGGVVLEVPDARVALATAASEWLRVHDPVVVGITGSNGKTTTKDFLAAALAGDRAAVASPGNLNSRWGMPAAILGFSGDEDVLVLEMGASGPDEIGRLARIAPPWMGCITNIGPAHLEFFGSVDEVARTKGQLVEALPPNGVAVLNRDDPRFESLRARSGARNVISFGTDSAADLRVESVESVDAGIAVRIGGVEGVLPVFGTVNAINAAAAMAMAEALGVRREDALARIGAATLSPHRSRRLAAAGRTLIDDSYNANPASVREALGSLAATRGVRRIAVLGEMAELGADAVAMHREVLGVALESGLDRVVVLGASYAAAAEGAEDPRIVRFDREEPAEIAAWLQTSTAEGDVVLFKGSRSAALERILDAFVEGVADPVEGID